MTLSVRHLILQDIVAKFKDADNPAAGGAPYFSVVELGPLSDTDHRKKNAIGVVPGTEREKFNFPYIECMLTVNVEFRMTVNKGQESPGDMGESTLTFVKQVITNNRTWSGQALDTKIIGSEVDLDTYQDAAVVGLCVCEVQFRHSHLDPTNPNPDV